MRSFILLFFTVIFFSTVIRGQETGYGPAFQTLLISNPGMAGSDTTGSLRLSYINFYPGKNYNFHSVFASCDSYFPLIHGGAAFYLSDDYLGGIINDLRGGISYAYFLKAGKDLLINAGLSASFFHRGFNFNNALLPDQIDPAGGRILPSGEVLHGESKTAFDIGAGFIFITEKISGGLSVSHLAQPVISVPPGSGEQIYRKYIMFLLGNFDVSARADSKIRPLAYTEIQNGNIYGGPGIVFETPVLGFNAMFLTGNEKNFDIQTGFSFTTGRLSAFYKYRFNLASGNNMLPFSLVIQTGLAYSLYNVDKRKNLRAVNFPKM